MGAQVTLMIGELLDNIDDIQNRIPPLLVILLAMIIISIISLFYEQFRSNQVYIKALHLYLKDAYPQK